MMMGHSRIRFDKGLQPEGRAVRTTVAGMSVFYIHHYAYQRRM